MLSLTVDRKGTTTGKGFDDPEAAHHFVTERAFIPELMRRCGIARWLWVQEFQSKTGDGWSHWHLLVDAEYVDLKLAWHLWRDTWGIGGVDLQRDRWGRIIKWQSPEHAVNYITKYLVKVPEGGYPDWVLDSPKRVRLVQGSKAVGALTSVKSALGPDLVESGPRGKDVKMRTRLENCGAKCVVICDTEDSQGEVHSRFVGDLAVSRERVSLWAAAGEVPGLSQEHVVGQSGREWYRLRLTSEGLRELRKLEMSGVVGELERRRMEARRVVISTRWLRVQVERQEREERRLTSTSHHQRQRPRVARVREENREIVASCSVGEPADTGDVLAEPSIS